MRKYIVFVVFWVGLIALQAQDHTRFQDLPLSLSPEEMVEELENRGLQQEGFDRDRPDTADRHTDFLFKQGNILVESFGNVVSHV